MDLSLNEDQAMIQDMARKFAQTELAPFAEKLDQEGDREFFLGNLKNLSELGFMGSNIDSQYGGTEAGAIGFSLAITEIARACASTAVTMSVTNMVAEVIQAVASEEQVPAQVVQRRVLGGRVLPDRNQCRLRSCSPCIQPLRVRH